MQELSDSRCARISAWQAGRRAGPWEVLAFLTNRCNLVCSICWQRWAIEEFGCVDTDHELSDQRWLDLVYEGAALGVREWTIVGAGEPMVRADLVMQLVDRICRHGMSATLHTNGTLLGQKRIEHLVKSGLRDIFFSLDAPSAEINDDIRSEGSFVRATDAIRRLVEAKRDHRTSYPRISITCVVTATNHDKMSEFVRLFRELECDGGLWPSTLTVQGTACKRFEIPASQLPDACAHLRAAMDCARGMGVDNNFESVLSVLEGAVSPPGTEQTPRQDTAMCYEPWGSIQVQMDGKVGPCCVAYDAQADTIATKSLADVWFGDYFHELRRRAMQRKYFDYCKSCPSHLQHRTKDLRAELDPAMLREQTGQTPPGLGFFGRVAYSLHRRGFTGTVRRAWEWVQIRLLGR